MYILLIESLFGGAFRAASGTVLGSALGSGWGMR